MYFQTSVSYDKINERGQQKRVTEHYLVDALSFTEAEARTTEERRPFISGDFTVKTAKRTKIAEVINSSSSRFYLAKIGFIAVDEKTAVEKRTVSQILVGGDSFSDACCGLAKAMEGTMADYEIVSIAESPILEVYCMQHKG